MNRQSLMNTLMGRDPDTRDLFSNLQNEIDRVFGQFRSGAAPSGSANMLVPKIDVEETDEAITIDAELPGVERGDVDVRIVDTVLTIEGNKKTESEKKEKNYHLVERSSGSFLRRIPLGFDVDADKVEANFRNGVLHMTIPKPPEAAASAKRIEVKDAS